MQHSKSLFFLLITLFSLSISSFAESNVASTPVSNTNAPAYLADLYGNTTNQKPEKKKAAANSFFNFLKMLLITALFGVAAYLIIRFMVTKSGLPLSENKNFIEIVANQSIGLGNYIEIVEIAGIYYILGLSSEGIRLIDKVSDKTQIDTITLNKKSLKPKNVRFFDLIPNASQKLKVDRLGFLKKQKDRLKKL